MEANKSVSFKRNWNVTVTEKSIVAVRKIFAYLCLLVV